MPSASSSFLILSLLLMGACNTAGRTGHPSPSAEGVAPLHPYPPGRWRLDTSRLGDVVLWVSHIVVRYQGVDSLDPCFSFADWHSNDSLPSRSRAEALDLAQRIAAEAARSPERFASLAREHSEDAGSRDRGGSLGGLPASWLQAWPGVLDALAATPPGRVTNVVETRYGFHIFQRREPAPDQAVSGARLVIAHDDAGWLRVLADRPIPQRSRAEARQLADRIYSEAVARPEAFTELVARYSEYADAARGGDMGSWSTRELSDYPREVEVLAQLEVGQVAPPIDSPLGFEILRRTPERQRQRYAAEILRLHFNPWTPDSDASSKASTWARARNVIGQIHSSASGLAGVPSDVCCRELEEWHEGRGIPAITSAVERLAMGDVAATPLLVGDSYVVARRVAPARVAPPSAVYELAAPAQPQVGFFLSQRGAEFTKAQFQIVDSEAVQRLGLETEQASALRRQHENLGDFAGANLAARQASLDALLVRTRTVLGDAAYQTYAGIMNRHIEQLLLPPASH